MNTCPSGMLCITHSSMIIIVLIFLMIIFYFYTNNMLCKKESEYKNEMNNNINNLVNKIEESNIKKDLTNEFLKEKINSIENSNMNNINNMDHLNPLIEPKKEYPSNRINIQTRGPPAAVQQLGTLSRMNYVNTDQDVGQNKEPYVLPIYGRPTYNRSSKWNYYTIFNNVKLNISHNNKSCMNEYGCEELMNGDTIKIPEINGEFKVNIYENSAMQYIPI